MNDSSSPASVPDSYLDREAAFFTAIGVKKATSEGEAEVAGTFGPSTSTVHRFWDPANPARLGDPSWSSSSDEDRALYSVLIGKAEQVGLGAMWKRDMIQATVRMTSQLAGNGISPGSVIQVEKKALAHLNSYVRPDIPLMPPGS